MEENKKQFEEAIARVEAAIPKAKEIVKRQKPSEPYNNIFCFSDLFEKLPDGTMLQGLEIVVPEGKEPKVITFRFSSDC